MKTSTILGMFWVAVLSTFLGFSTPAFGDGSRDMVNQALDLTQQALNEGGPPPSNDQRKELLKQALDLLGNETVNFHGHVGRAMNAIRAALNKLKKGDPFDTATEDIRRAQDQLRDAMSIAT